MTPGRNAIIGTLLVAVLVLAGLYDATSFSANSPLRRTIFMNGHPISAFKADLPQEPAYTDDKQRDCYDMMNPRISDGSENSIPGICMKKDRFGMYRDITIGIY